MKRRDFIALLAGAAVFAPLVARAQEPGRVYRLGAVIPVGRQTPGVAAFFDEMRVFGFVEGQNLTVLPNGFGVYQRPTGRAGGSLGQSRARHHHQRSGQLHARASAVDPHDTADRHDRGHGRGGACRSLARPGGNTTGISLLSPELDGKRLEILAEGVPGLRKMAALADSTVTPQRHLDSLQDAARRRGFELSVFGVAKREEVVPAIEAAKAAGAQALNLLATPLFTVHPRDFIERIVALRIPAMHQWPEIAEDGGLMGYGPRFAQTFRQRARMVAKILRGAKPADIPVEQPTRFELVINLKTAKAIGHEIPAGLVLRADKVIE